MKQMFLTCGKPCNLAKRSRIPALHMMKSARHLRGARGVGRFAVSIHSRTSIRLRAVEDAATPADTVVAPPPSTTYSLKAPSIENYPSVTGKTVINVEDSPTLFPGLEDLTSVGSQANEAVAKAAAEASSAASQITGSALDVLSGLSNTASDSAGQITSSFSQATQSLTGAVGGVAGEAAGIVSSAANQVSAAAAELQGAADSAVGGVANSLISSLPPEVKEGLVVGGGVAAKYASDVLDLAAQYPNEAAGATALASASLLYTWYSSSFGGFSGELDAKTISKLLQDSSKEIVLVDIREEEDLLEEGIPLLKLGARFRASSLPLSSADPLTPPDLIKLVKNKSEIRVAVAAALISGLKRVKGSSSVVLMDSTGTGSTKDLARALRRVGVYDAYVIKGGFKGWLEAGLPVAEGEYDDSATSFLRDEIEVAFAELAKPENRIPVVAASVFAVTALVNYHATFEVIGLWGTAVSIYNGSALRLVQSVAGVGLSLLSSSSSRTRSPGVQEGEPEVISPLPPVPEAPIVDMVALQEAIDRSVDSEDSGTTAVQVKDSASV